jgi:hypothetical protein
MATKVQNPEDKLVAFSDASYHWKERVLSPFA